MATRTAAAVGAWAAPATNSVEVISMIGLSTVTSHFVFPVGRAARRQLADTSPRAETRIPRTRTNSTLETRNSQFSGGASPRAETRIPPTCTNSALEARNSQLSGGAEHFKLETSNFFPALQSLAPKNWSPARSRGHLTRRNPALILRLFLRVFKPCYHRVTHDLEWPGSKRNGQALPAR